MGKINSTFEKGLSTRFSPLKQPVGTYPYAKNIVRDAQSTVKSERGTKLLANIPSLTNAVILGETTVEDEIFYFIKSDEGSTIGKLDSDNNFTRVLHTGAGAVESLTSDIFKLLTTTSPYEAKGLYVFNTGSGNIFITFTLDIATNEVTVSFAAYQGSYVSGALWNGTRAFAGARLAESLWPANTVTIPTTSGDYQIQIDASGLVSFGLADGGTGSNDSVSFTSGFTYQAKGLYYNTISSDVLNFNAAYPIDAVGRKDHTGSTILYWTDDFNEPRRMNTAEYIDANNYDNAVKLFLNPSLPVIDNATVEEGGGLTSGIYSFAARLGTATGNTTIFSPLSNPAPIVNEGKSGGEDQYDGAEPQTPSGKSISITVSNVDISYSFIEIAVLTYIGYENTPRAHTIAKLPVTDSTIQFDYYSDSQFIEEISLEELIQNAIEYETAKNIVQKDNFLFLSNLGSKDYSSLDEKITNIANNAQIWYNVEGAGLLQWATRAKRDITVNWQGDGDDTPWAPSEGSDGYDEYSFKLTPETETLFNNYKNPDIAQGKRTYQRDEVYSFALVPIFKGGVYGTAYHIPGWSNTDNEDGSADQGRCRGYLNADGTYHHRMPSNKKSPYVTYTGPEGFAYIRPLQIQVKNLNFNDSELQAALEGYVIVRQRRNKPNNGIIVAQGIAKPFFEYEGNLLPIPFTGKTNLIHLSLNSAYLNVWQMDENVAPNYAAFYSPDVLHTVTTQDDTSTAQTIAQQIVFEMTKVGDTRMTTEGDGSTAYTKAVLATMMCATDRLEAADGIDVTNLGVQKPIVPGATTHVDPFSVAENTNISFNDNKIVKAAGTTGYVGIKLLNSNLPVENQKYLEATYGVLRNRVSSNGFAANKAIMQANEEKSTLSVYNLYATPANVYGTIESAEYISVGEVYFRDSVETTQSFYGGDTFITKYMFLIGDDIISEGEKYRANAEVWIESKGNYNYRHYIPQTQDGETTIEGTMPYAPKYENLLEWDPVDSGILGLWQYDCSKGPGVDYNKHYHFENVVNKFYPKDLFLDTVTNFPNRIIYSLQSFENEQFDAYRVFLTNNYHDIPKETGDITNMFEYGNTLYAHTPHALWRTFVNEKTMQNTTSGEIILGNGGLFPLPSEQLYTEEGGFAGTTAKFASVNTPYGRVFVDDHQQKIFILVGTKLQEISQEIENYFQDTIVPGAINNYRLGYDPLNKRFILSIQPTNGANVGLSLSYSFENQSWTSFHDYGINVFSQRDNKLLGTVQNNIYEFGTGYAGSLVGTRQESVLNVALNMEPDITKDFINFKWIQANKDTIFSNINLSTENYGTGDVIPSLVTSFADEQNFLPLGIQHVHAVGGEFRMTIPPDNRVDEFYDSTLFRPSIKGKYGIVELTYVPEDDSNTVLELEHFSTEYLNVAE